MLPANAIHALALMLRLRAPPTGHAAAPTRVGRRVACRAGQRAGRGPRRGAQPEQPEHLMDPRPQAAWDAVPP